MSIKYSLHSEDKTSGLIYKELYEFLRDRCTRADEALSLIDELIESVVTPHKEAYSQLLRESVKSADIGCANILKMAVIMTTPPDKLHELKVDGEDSEPAT